MEPGQKPDRRKLGIILAVILGVLAALYLGGLLGQMLSGYQKWLDAGGLGGGAVMHFPSPNPFVCIAHAFTPYGLRGLLIILGAAAAIVLYVKLNDRFSSKDQDDRNFTRSKKGTYGTAGWMPEKEIKEVLDVTPWKDAAGTILGKKDGKVLSLPEDTQFNRHIVCFGATGSRKSRGFVRPYLFQAMKRGESVVVVDPKTEIYRDTSELFKKNGYQVRVLNLVQPEFSDSWNCMADLGGDSLLCQVLTEVIITNTSEGKEDRFWQNGESNLLKALLLLVSMDKARGPDEKNLAAVYQFLTNNDVQTLDILFRALPLTHPARAPFSLFCQASDKVKNDILSGLGTRLQVLQNEAVRKIISHNDIDLTEPGKAKCAWFVVISDQESSLDFLTSLFFTCLFIKLVRFADGTPEGRCPVPVNLVLEEFNNVGTLGKDFGRRLNTLRSRYINVIMVVQSLGQLKNRYPNELWAEIVGAADTQVMLGCTDELTAMYWSNRSGDVTVDVQSMMTVRKSIAVAQVIPQYRQTEGQGRRKLLTTDEVLRLNNDELLIVLRGCKMIRAQKPDFTEHPYAKLVEPVHISSYTPARRMAAPVPQTEPRNAPDEQRPTPGSRLFSASIPPEDF